MYHQLACIQLHGNFQFTSEGIKTNGRHLLLLTNLELNSVFKQRGEFLPAPPLTSSLARTLASTRCYGQSADSPADFLRRGIEQTLRRERG
jgi:hypothetical protein